MKHVYTRLYIAERNCWYNKPFYLLQERIFFVCTNSIDSPGTIGSNEHSYLSGPSHTHMWPQASWLGMILTTMKMALVMGKTFWISIAQEKMYNCPWIRAQLSHRLVAIIVGPSAVTLFEACFHKFVLLRVSQSLSPPFELSIDSNLSFG